MADTLLLSVVKNHSGSGIDLKTDLRNIREQIFQCEMNFNIDPNRQAQ